MEFVFMAVLFAALIGSFFYAQHRDKILYMSMLDKKVVINNYREYSKLYMDYHFSKDRITSIEELNESELALKKKIEWFNKKYRRYGYYIPPKTLLFEEE